MNNRKVRLYGVASFIPFAFFICLGIVMILRTPVLLDYLSSTSGINGIVAVIIELTIQNLSVLALFVAIYIAIVLVSLNDLFKNRNIPEERQAAWVLVILTAGIVGLPLYWYMNIYSPSKAGFINIEMQ